MLDILDEFDDLGLSDLQDDFDLDHKRPSSYKLKPIIPIFSHRSSWPPVTREELNIAIDLFLLNGGKITVLPPSKGPDSERIKPFLPSRKL